jgi:phage replication O-like protein O
MKNESPYTKVPNSIFDIEGLNVYERLILLFIIRRTIGFNKKSDGISLSQFIKFTGASKPTVLKAIENLKKMKCINIHKQTTSTGGKHYNRYTPLVNEIDKGSKGGLLGLVNEVYIQKENNTKIEREDIFFNFYETVKNRKILLKDFIDYLIIVENVKKPIKYASTIEKKINSRDKETLKNFDKWFIQNYTDNLNSKYKEYLFDDKKIYRIFNHYEMLNNSMFGIALVGNSTKDVNKFFFNSIEELETFLNKGKNEII